MQMIDPPDGHLYGFPIPFLPDVGQSIDNYLLLNGYPESEIFKWPAGVPSRIWTATPNTPLRRSLRDRGRLSGPAIRTFVNLAHEWRLESSERLALIAISRNEYSSVVARAQARSPMALSTMRLMRLSAVFNIYAALQILFNDATGRSAWLHGLCDDEPFGGRSPLILMTKKDPQGLLEVAAYLQVKLAGN